MQQAFQKNNAIGLHSSQQKQQSQSNLTLNNGYSLNTRQGNKNESYNFATVTANTGNMIVNNQPLTSKMDQNVVIANIQAMTKASTQNRISNKSKCLSDSKHAYVHSSGNPQLGNKSLQPTGHVNKYNQSNHHTLQCISDINEFKQKINMVLQTQAFPNNGPQVATNSQSNSNSMNPTTSRLAYSNNLHESPTPQFNMHSFQKRTIKTQNNNMYDSEVSKEIDKQMNSAFQSFKNNAKQSHFIPLDSELQDSGKYTQGSYLLRGQKEKNRNQFIQTYKNGNSVSEGADAETNLIYRGAVGSNEKKALSEKQVYVTNFLGNQQNSSQRRKIQIDQVNDMKDYHKNLADPSQCSERNSRNLRGTYVTDLKQIHKAEFLDQIDGLLVELMDEKDREALKEICLKYCTDLKNLIQYHHIEGDDIQVQTNDSTKPSDDKRTEVNNAEQMTDSISLNEAKLNQKELLDSSEKFKENEKNLKEERLKKESKIEIPLGLDNRKVLKSTSPTPALQKEASIEDCTVNKEEVSLNSQQLRVDNSQKQESNSLVPQSVLNQTEAKEEFHETQKKLHGLSNFIENLENPSAHPHVPSMASRQMQQNIRTNQYEINGFSKHVVSAQPNNDSDWMQNIQQIKMFLNSLNVQKPSPQQINVMNNSKQRLDLFKILQAREHVKFTNIQSEKMTGLQQKLEEEYENKRLPGQDQQKFAEYLAKNGLSTISKSGNYADAMNQQRHAHSQFNLQQLKNLKKQQQNDQKAFSIFQMNELAQFRSMSDGQQKQILLNNLQQGKFDDFETLIEPITFCSSFLKTNVASLENQGIVKLSKDEVKNTIEQASEMLKKSSLNQMQRNQEFSKINSREFKKGEIVQSELDNSNNRKSLISPAINSVQDSTPNSSAQESSKILRKNGTSSDLNNISDWNQAIKSNGFSEPTSELAHSKSYKQHMFLLQHNFEQSKAKFEHIIRQNTKKQQRIKIFFQQMNEAFGAYFNNYRMYQQQMSHNQGGLTDSLLHQQNRSMFSQNGELNERNSVKVKARQSMGISNLPRPIDRSKSKPGAPNAASDLNGKQGTASASTTKDKPAEAQKDVVVLKKEEEKKDENKVNESNGEMSKEGEGGETAVQEIKKPRYFPPKKLPNPFENAAQEQEKFMQARKEALQKYSMLSKNRFKQEESAPLKYVIRPGNNSRIIYKVMEKSGRLDQKSDNEGNISFPGWEPADDYYDSLYNFKWKPTSNGIKYDLISKHGLKQLVNHVRGHYALTTKDNLFLNMKSYYETQKFNIYDVLPLTIVVDYLKDDVGDKVETFFNILKIVDKNIDSSVDIINQKMQELQIQREKSVKSQYKFSNCMHNKQNLWLLKPTGFNRGIGIHIFNSFDMLRDIMSNFYGIGRGAKDKTSIFQTHNNNHVPQQLVDQNGEKQTRNFSFVIQKLIERPLLFHARKFDIRTWVLFNSSDGKTYMWSESYVRTSSTTYTDFDPNANYQEQITMQLTNNAVQKDKPEYGKYEEGNIVSLDCLFGYVQSQPEISQNLTKNELKSKFLESAKRLIQDSMKSVKGKLVAQNYTFELFGYDFIIDEDLNTMLIEINTNPCLEEPNRLLKHFIPRMIDDLFNITMDPLFYQTDGKQVYKSAFPLPADLFTNSIKGETKIVDSEPHPGYKDTQNLFQLVCTMEQN